VTAESPRQFRNRREGGEWPSYRRSHQKEGLAAGINLERKRRREEQSHRGVPKANTHLSPGGKGKCSFPLKKKGEDSWGEGQRGGVVDKGKTKKEGDFLTHEKNYHYRRDQKRGGRFGPLQNKEKKGTGTGGKQHEKSNLTNLKGVPCAIEEKGLVKGRREEGEGHMTEKEAGTPFNHQNRPARKEPRHGREGKKKEPHKREKVLPRESAQKEGRLSLRGEEQMTKRKPNVFHL